MKTEPTPEPELSKFEKDMAEGSQYWLGPIVRSYEIGEYQLIEYRAKDFETSSKTYGEETGATRFSCYIKGRGISRSAESLDSALATVIAWKHDGCNSQAAEFFMKMIAKEEP